jgi:hypothetical protein
MRNLHYYTSYRLNTQNEPIKVPVFGQICRELVNLRSNLIYTALASR